MWWSLFKHFGNFHAFSFVCVCVCVYTYFTNLNCAVWIILYPDFHLAWVCLHISRYFFKNTIANGYILSIEDCYTLFNHSPIPLFNHSAFAQIFFLLMITLLWICCFQVLMISFGKAYRSELGEKLWAYLKLLNSVSKMLPENVVHQQCLCLLHWPCQH